MDKQLCSIEKQAGQRRNYATPPLHLWHPPLSGDIPILITADGRWYHDGGLIEREPLVQLFASILRREDDGDYYLVTPAEKWRIKVELHPLLVTDIDCVQDGAARLLKATLNTGRQVLVNEEHPLFLEPAVGAVAAISLQHGLTALFSRPAWYRLVEMAAERDGVATLESGAYSFRLAIDPDTENNDPAVN